MAGAFQKAIQRRLHRKASRQSIHRRSPATDRLPNRFFQVDDPRRLLHLPTLSHRPPSVTQIPARYLISHGLFFCQVRLLEFKLQLVLGLRWIQTHALRIGSFKRKGRVISEDIVATHSTNSR